MDIRMIRTPVSMFLKRSFSRSASEFAKPSISIVGAGPAGFYAAKHLLKKLSDAQIDIYERLPVPYGLVRFGVAPDHPEVKNVEHTFAKTAESPNVRFIGNVTLGKDISLDELKQAYHIVLLTYGAEINRKLEIPGEDLKNVISARNIVGWYNGNPWDADLKIDLSGDSVAILGQGNVAIDVARILLSPVDQLKSTDITQYALDHLASSKVKKVYLIGRRGPLQAAFTIAELREMLKLPGCSTLWNPVDFEGVADVVPNLARPKKRITELMLKSLNENSAINSTSRSKVFQPVFYRSPLEIIGTEKAEELKLGITKLVGDDILNKKAMLTNDSETISCQLVVPSIGYRSIKVDSSIPFDDQRGIVKNENFRVEDGVFVSGWLSTGPTGVILTTMSNAFASANEILKYLESKSVLEEAKPGYDLVEQVLKSKNVQIVSWKDWLKIDTYEQNEGKKVNKPREKIADINKMLKIASS